MKNCLKRLISFFGTKGTEQLDQSTLGVAIEVAEDMVIEDSVTEACKEAKGLNVAGDREEEASAQTVPLPNPQTMHKSPSQPSPSSSHSFSQAQEVRNCISYWKKLEKSNFASKIIEQGLIVPFRSKIKVNSLCKKKIFPRNTSKKNKLRIRKEVKSLLEQDVIERAPYNIALYENHLFCITKASGKLRVILDMKELNEHIRLPNLKMFRYQYCFQACLVSSYACKIDLSNAFWHISIHKNYRRYFAFSCDNVSYVWKAMPFGLRIAPYLFCKLMQPVINHLRTKYNIYIFYYLDDILLLAPSEEIALQQSRIVLEVLAKAGLKVNLEKSMLVPSEEVTFLGVTIDLRNKTLRPSSVNVASCIQKVQDFVQAGKVHLVDFQSLVGSLNFSATYVKFGKLNLSPIYKFRPAFSEVRRNHIPFNLVTNLEFWEKVESYLPIPIPNNKLPIITVTSDASSQGWGAQVTWASGKCTSFSGKWNSEQLQEHINLKELRAVFNVINDNLERFANSVIRVFSDNKSTVTWLNKGTSTRSEGARHILSILTAMSYDFTIKISAKYVKGSQNLLADSLSRSLEYHPELTLKQETFDRLCSLLDFKPDVDICANTSNHKCESYFSATRDDKAAGHNALTTSWNNYKYPYAFPPSHLVNKIIFRFLNSNCNSLLLLVPRSNTNWHRNLLRLNPRIVDFRFNPQDFLLNNRECTLDLAHILSEMNAYILSRH